VPHLRSLCRDGTRTGRLRGDSKGDLGRGTDRACQPGLDLIRQPAAPRHQYSPISRMMLCEKQRIDHNEKYDSALSAVGRGRISARPIVMLPALTTAMHW